ncbi:MAG: efflux RND transporter periplasmic adaptor subunit, partial [Alphaproteobacteria bacterium]|nr:efflux RND transporter periplasmic adaptor subunit [Alphaproteobacteria bacterium]
MKRLTNQQRLLGGAAAAVFVFGGGFAVWSMTRGPEAPAEAAAQTEEEHGAGEALEMDAARIQAAGIILAPVGSGSLSAEIVAQGTVVGTPQGEAVLAARADGVISRVSLRLGDSVRAGQTVALIESREASSIAAERSTAQARLTAARQALAREQRLFDAQITARQDLEAAQTVLAEAEAESRRTSSAASAARVSGDGRSTGVVSPISGRVTAADATLGAFVTAGTELFRVANASQIEVQASVSADDAGRIAPGDRASITLPEGEVQATVRSITPGVDAESRAATVLLTVSGV